MSRNREPVKPVESQSDSGEEEYEEGDSQESDSEPEPELMQTATKKKPQSPMAAKSQKTPPRKAPSSSEEEESGSETDSKADGPDSNAMPLVPMEDTQKLSNGATKARSKPKEPKRVTPAKSAAAKRPAEDTAKDANKLKKLKNSAASETSEKKSNLFQRLWSEDDEIVILRGIIDFTSNYKSDPMSDLTAFHEFIKKKLTIDVSRTQLQDKIRRLKKKYANKSKAELQDKIRRLKKKYANKSKAEGSKMMTFSKPHEQNVYDLSKVIWGNESSKEIGGVKVVGSPKANVSKKVNAGESEETEMKSSKKRPHSNSVGATMEERMLIAGEEVFGLGQRLEGEQEWRKLRLEDMQLLLKLLELRTAQTKLVLEAMKGRYQ